MTASSNKKAKVAVTLEQIEAALEERSNTDRRQRRPSGEEKPERRKGDRRKQAH